MRIYVGKDQEPVDYCRFCYPKHREIALKYDDDDCDADHPDYTDTPYKCDDCGRTLTKADN
jgi:hypothetical protein